MQTLRNSANPSVFITISKSQEAAISLISAVCVWVWVSLGVCVWGVLEDIKIWLQGDKNLN